MIVESVVAWIHWQGGCLAAQSTRGDLTFAGWLITIAYFVAAALCGRAAKRERWATPDANRPASLFWPVLCAAMLALGLNKQLDLQTDLTEFGRQFAREGGWYQHRRMIQGLFIALLCAGAAGTLACFARLNRERWQHNRLAFVGVVYLLTFILIRAASFHHVDMILFHLPVGKAWINTLLEAGGQVLIGIAADKAARTGSRSSG